MQVQDQRKQDWFWTDNVLVEQFMSIIKPDAFAVYSVLAKYADKETRTSWPSHKLLAKLTGLSKPTVIKCLQILEKVGLLDTNDRYVPVHYPSGAVGERQSSNLYTLLPVPERLTDEQRKVFTLAVKKINDDRRRGKRGLPLPEEAGVNAVTPPPVNRVNPTTSKGLPHKNGVDGDTGSVEAGVNRVNPNKTHGLNHELDSESSAAAAPDVRIDVPADSRPHLQASWVGPEENVVENGSGHASNGSIHAAARDNAVRQAIVDAWFALADAERQRGGKVPELPRRNNKEEWGKFRNAVKKAAEVPIAFEWAVVDIGPYLAECYAYRLREDEERREPFWKGKAFYLGSLSLRSWWVDIKQPALARRASLAPAAPDPALTAHMQQAIATYDDMSRRRGAAKAAELAAKRRAFGRFDEEDETAEAVD